MLVCRLFHWALDPPGFLNTQRHRALGHPGSLVAHLRISLGCEAGGQAPPSIAPVFEFLVLQLRFFPLF